MVRDVWIGILARDLFWFGASMHGTNYLSVSWLSLYLLYFQVISCFSATGPIIIITSLKFTLNLQSWGLLLPC